MCKGEISNKDASQLAPLALFLNQYFNTFISEGPLLWLALVKPAPAFCILHLHPHPHLHLHFDN